jgi:hypothetical protein
VTSAGPHTHDHEAHRAELTAAHGTPRPFDTAYALRLLGQRAQVHPRDAYAFAYRDQAAADAWQAATRTHHGIPSLGTAPSDAGVIGVYDLRPALAGEFGAPVTDPGLPDGWTPAGRRGGHRRAAVLPGPEAWPQGGRRRAAT